MIIHPNGVAVCGSSHHAVWCKTEGLVHDRFMAGIITRLIDERKIKVAVDGGANIGSLSRPMIDAGVKVHAFEPNPEAVACLKHNCPEATIYECALGDQIQEGIFNPLENAGASYVTTSPQWLDLTPSRRTMIYPLDHYEISPGLIKLDCEGFEVMALNGARKMIRKHKPAIICEVNQGALERAGESEASLLQVIHDLGYSAKILQPDCDWGDPQFDFLALPI